MTMRQMKNEFDGYVFYQSTFDPNSGTLVRVTDVPEKGRHGYGLDTLVEMVAMKQHGIREYGKGWEEFENRWNRELRAAEGDGYVHWGARRYFAWSPSPETVDVKITDWCNFGCDYCYQSSTTAGKHASRELLERIFTLKHAPYQIAFGGGEPTAHPDFPWFLSYTREKGTVPNYTTAGHIVREDVLKATNEYCGGVALTYHAFKGPAYFREVYETWREKLAKHVLLNVHVIADDRVAQSLDELASTGLRDLNIVLLAYYPVGRGGFSGVMSKHTYQNNLPYAIMAAQQKAGFRFAFSEGLLPYFLSMKIPGIDTRYAVRQEGLFSCYVDDKGYVSNSSFSPFEPDDRSDAEVEAELRTYYEEPDALASAVADALKRRAQYKREHSIFESDFQYVWTKLDGAHYPHYKSCMNNCKYLSQCATPHDTHYLQCAFADHNFVKTKKDRVILRVL
jgi:MoaA/NifB/PqqE/SkfB family radical SAM enzyme